MLSRLAFVASLILLAACVTTGAPSQTPQPTVPSGGPSPTPPNATPSPSSIATTVVGPRLSWSAPVSLQTGDSVFDIVKWRDGYVATGQSTEAGGYAPATFVSQDGQHWRRTSIFDASPVLVASDTRLLAFVSQIPTPLGTQVWASTDGVAWQRDDRLALADVSLTLAAARGSTVLAAGTGKDGSLRLWRSEAGKAWTQTPMPSPTAVIRDVVSVDAGLLVIGRDGDADSGSGVGVRGAGLPAAWLSADAQSWSAARVEGTRATGAQLTGVFRVKGGYLAVGSDDSASQRSPLLWTSVDARDWQVVGPPSHWGLAVSDGRQLVVFGYADAQAGTLGVWVTPDAHAWTQLAFAGDVADVPSFIQSANDSSRVDRIFASPDAIIVIGQRKGQITAWSTSRS